MTYQLAKIVLWVLLCIPILIIGLYLAFNVFGLNRDITNRNKRKEKARRDAELERRAGIMRRSRFEEDYERMRGGYDDE